MPGSTVKNHILFKKHTGTWIQNRKLVDKPFQRRALFQIIKRAPKPFSEIMSRATLSTNTVSAPITAASAALFRCILNYIIYFFCSASIFRLPKSLSYLNNSPDICIRNQSSTDRRFPGGMKKALRAAGLEFSPAATIVGNARSMPMTLHPAFKLRSYVKLADSGLYDVEHFFERNLVCTRGFFDLFQASFAF